MRPTSFDDFELSVGDLIRGGLASKGINQCQAADALKLDVELLSMIEDGEHRPPYPEHLINAIVRDYAIFLELDPLQIRSVYWRDVVEKTFLEEQRGSKQHSEENSKSMGELIKKFFASWS